MVLTIIELDKTENKQASQQMQPAFERLGLITASLL